MDITDSGFYIAIGGPSFILWAVGLVLGASIVPVALGIALLIESRRGRKLRASRTEGTECVDDKVVAPRALTRADLRNKVAVVALAVPVAVLLAMSIFAYYWVWTLFGVSSVVCATLWLRLRRDGVRYAEVYAIAAWMLPRVVWGVFVLIRAAVTGDDLYDFFLQEPSVDNSMLSDMFGGPLIFAVVLVAASWAVGTALMAAQRNDIHMRPLTMISLVIPCAVYFWFVEPFGFGHAGLTLMVVGYAVSREMRRAGGNTSASVTHTGHTPQSSSFMLAPPTRLDTLIVCVAVSVAVFAVALVGQLDGTNPEVLSIVSWVIIGTAGATAAAVVRARGRAEAAPFVAVITAILSITVSVLLRDIPPMLSSDFWVDNSFNFLLFVLIQVLAAGSVGIAVLVVSIVKGVHLRYGAVALGIGALLLLAWTYDIADFDSELVAWMFTQWFGATIAVCVVLWAMWHLFGPGALQQPPTREPDASDLAVSARAE